jgi:hypothetical protein
MKIKSFCTAKEKSPDWRYSLQNWPKSLLSIYLTRD